MALQKQIHIYNLDTSCFYNDVEQLMHRRLNKMYLFRKTLRKRLNNKNINEDTKNKISKYFTNTNRRIQNLKTKLCGALSNNTNIRYLNKNSLNDRNVISIFESSLTRIIGTPINTLTTDIMVVRVYFFDVLKDIIYNGFLLDDEKYVFFTASAGQIRTKKAVFIKESILLKYQDTLMCGLTKEEINKFGGVNINKYLAYLALCNSATDLWEDFDIDKAIVVDDFETLVTGTVDFINDKDYNITRKEMGVPIEHTDGCGMILPSKCKKNMMVRLPWIKGLLSSFPYDKFIKKFNCDGKVKDIYGKEWDILKDGIEVIFTKSQFKMNKYYQNQFDKNSTIIKYGWDTYKENYKKFNCQAGKCNEEEDVFKNAKICYQMLQTLTDISEDELKSLCHRAIKNITNIGYDRKTMLRVLGVTQANTNKNFLQQAIEIYPELLNDTYCREILKQVKKKLVIEGRAAKIDTNAKYTFIIPDLYAFCEHLFFHSDKPKGLLNNGEVFCKIYKDVDKLDCLRSPHLFREHAVRNNIVDDEKSEWFITNGVYTSCHDLISKILQFDVDGDFSLIVADKQFVNIAERNMEDIVPLYYKMANANAEKITGKSLYHGLISAYTGGNIGIVSNNITKIWNNNNIDLDVIKLLCMENNFVIDYAKTLYKPKRPDCKNKQINSYTKSKVPHFFVYAKKKMKKQVAKKNNSVVNRLESLIPNPRINFKAVGLDNFDYKMLMNSQVDITTEQAKEIIDKYTELDLNKYFIINRSEDGNESDKIGNLIYLYSQIREKILLVNNNIKYVVDILIEYLYNYKNSNYKTTLWECFGDVIVENLKYNVAMNQTYCEVCGDLIEQSANNKKYCSDCAREVWEEQNRINNRERMRKIRTKQ